MATWTTTANDITWTAVDDPSVSWTVQLNPTVTGGGGAVDSVNGQTGVVVLDADDVDGRDIYRPALVLSPASVSAFGGSMVDGVGLTIAALAASVPVGQDILIWNGTNGGAPNGSYTHAGSGTFNYSARQYLNATSFADGCVLVQGPDFATTGAAGEASLWTITTANGTDFGLVAQGGFAQEAGTGHITISGAPVVTDRPVLFADTTGLVVKQSPNNFAIEGHTHDTLANVATNTILGRLTAGSGDSEELTLAQVRAALGGWQVLHDVTLESDAGTAADPLSYDVTGYSRFRVMFIGNATRNSTLDTLRMRLNGESGNVYGADAAALTSGWALGNIPGSQTNTDRVGMVDVRFGGASGYLKVGISESTNVISTSTVGAADVDAGLFSTITDAVTSIQLFANQSSIRAGSRIVIEGLA